MAEVAVEVPGLVRSNSILARSNSGLSRTDSTQWLPFLRRCHAEAEKEYVPPQKCPLWCLCLCANEWFCLGGRCEAHMMPRNGYCVPCAATSPGFQGCCDPCCCLLTTVSPCCGIMRMAGLGEACSCDGDKAIWIAAGASALIPPLGFLCGPLVLAGIYKDKGLHDQVRPDWCQCLLCAIPFECCPVPCAIGLPCCLYPFTAMQLWREENESVQNHKPTCAEQYEQARQEKWGTDNVEFTIVRGLFRPKVTSGVETSSESAVEVFGTGKVTVSMFNTLAEVLDMYQAQWVNGESIELYKHHDWLSGLLGSKESKLCAVMRNCDDEGPAVWVNEMVVTPTTVMREVFEQAQATTKQAHEQYGEQEMPVVVVDEDKAETEVNLKACELVGTLGDGMDIIFSDNPVDRCICWGQAFELNGMSSNCVIELTKGGTSATIVEQWTPCNTS